VTVVTLTGEAIDPTGAVTGGSEPPLEETLLARARELREIEAALAAARARLREQTERLDRVRADLEQTSIADRRRGRRLQAMRVAEVAAAKDRERLEEERTRIAAELEIGALEASGLAAPTARSANEWTTSGRGSADVARRVAEAREHICRAAASVERVAG
jgi:chromosome segregation protein